VPQDLCWVILPILFSNPSLEKQGLSFLISIFRSLVYSNIWIAFAAGLLAIETYLLVGLPLSKPMFWLVFCCTLFTYNFQRLVRFRNKKIARLSERHQWIEDQRDYLIVLTVLSFVGMFTGLLMIDNGQVIYLLVPLGLISTGYVMTVFGKGSTRFSLRDIPTMKIIFIAFTWAGATVTLPLFDRFGWEAFTNVQGLLLFVERFLFIIAITIPFDVRDLSFDHESKKTIPQLLGTKRALLLAVVLLLISVLIALFRVQIGALSMATLTGLAISGILSVLLILRSTEKRDEIFYTGWMDGTMVFQFLCVWLCVELL
jgi:4-hydroxybenzoate polyprenyltransferase